MMCRHDGCDGDEHGDCDDALDNCDHCCGTGVAIGRQLRWMSQWIGVVVVCWWVWLLHCC
jgi:hypothetical protein